MIATALLTHDGKWWRITDPASDVQHVLDQMTTKRVRWLPVHGPFVGAELPVASGPEVLGTGFIRSDHVTAVIGKYVPE